MFPVKVIECGRNEQQILKNLLTLYSYDLSEVTGWKLDERGIFETPAKSAPFSTPEIKRYLILVEDEPAGFATISPHSHLEPSKDAWDMHQFFVVRKFRRQGIGTRVSHLLFDLHPGQWEIREYSENKEAQRFWRNTVHSYTRGQYGEMLVQNEVWHGPVQRFVSQSSGSDAVYGSEDRGIVLRSKDLQVKGESPRILRRARTEADFERCGEILKRLPQWLQSEETRSKLLGEIRGYPTFLSVDQESNQTMGFLTLNHYDQFTTRIHLLGVDPDKENGEIGKGLLQFAENESRERGSEILATILPREEPSMNEEQGYNATVQDFYRSAGFRSIDIPESVSPRHTILVKPLL